MDASEDAAHMPLRIPVSDTRAYKQFGNAVAVPVVRAIARQLLITLGVQIQETPGPPALK